MVETVNDGSNFSSQHIEFWQRFVECWCDDDLAGIMAEDAAHEWRQDHYRSAGPGGNYCFTVEHALDYSWVAWLEDNYRLRSINSCRRAK